MITLRELVRMDRAIGAITSSDCQLISTVLHSFNKMANHWLLKFFIPKDLRVKMLDLRMLAAILDSSPTEKEGSLNTQIQQAMDANKK